MHCFSTKVVDPDPEELASLLSTCGFQSEHQCQLSDAAEMQGLECQILFISCLLLQVGMQQPLQMRVAVAGAGAELVEELELDADDEGAEV